MSFRMIALGMAGTMLGCGSGKASDDHQDPGTVPTIVETTPGDEASAVSVLGVLSIEMSGAVDPDTVNEDTVRVRNDYGAVVDAPVSWDGATLTITVDPTYALRHGRRYQLQIDGLLDPHGREVDPATVDFTTYYNPIASSIAYEAGVIVGRSVASYDEKGRMTERRRYGDPGDDGEWFTDDDVASSYMEQVYDDVAGTRTQRLVDPGDDGMILTADDVVIALWERSLNARGDPTREVEKYNGGPDGVLGTPDDIVNRYYDLVYDEEGQVIRTVSYEDPGDDGLWLTEDDPITYVTDLTWDQTVLVGQHGYAGPGDDGEWFTEDDFLWMYIAGTFLGDDLQEVTYWLPFGDDGVPETEDDVPRSYDARSYTADRQYLGRTSYEAAGPDGEWFTSDDVSDFHTTVEYDDEGNITREIARSSPGADQLWGTADDHWNETTYDAF